MNTHTRKACLLVFHKAVALFRRPGLEKRRGAMKSKATLATFFILMFVQLSSCRGNIPITGQEATEKSAVPTFTQIVQSSPEATVLSTVSPEAPACQTPTATVKARNVYLLAGPDLRFVATTRYPNGEQFTVLGRYKDWFHVEAPDGKQGWLYKDWLTIPPSIDTNNICSISEQELPPTPMPPPKKEHQCVPTYYVSCP